MYSIFTQISCFGVALRESAKNLLFSERVLIQKVTGNIGRYDFHFSRKGCRGVARNFQVVLTNTKMVITLDWIELERCFNLENFQNFKLFKLVLITRLYACAFVSNCSYTPVSA